MGRSKWVGKEEEKEPHEEKRMGRSDSARSKQTKTPIFKKPIAASVTRRRTRMGEGFQEGGKSHKKRIRGPKACTLHFNEGGWEETGDRKFIKRKTCGSLAEKSHWGGDELRKLVEGWKEKTLGCWVGGAEESSRGKRSKAWLQVCGKKRGGGKKKTGT